MLILFYFIYFNMNKMVVSFTRVMTIGVVVIVQGKPPLVRPLRWRIYGYRAENWFLLSSRPPPSRMFCFPIARASTTYDCVDDQSPQKGSRCFIVMRTTCVGELASYNPNGPTTTYIHPQYDEMIRSRTTRQNLKTAV